MTDRETLRRMLDLVACFTASLIEASQAERFAILCQCSMHLDILGPEVARRLKQEAGRPD